MRFMYNKKGQTAIEFSTLVIILLAVFLAVGIYFKRGVQGRWKSAIDEIGDQYDPLTADTNISYTLTSETDTRLTTVEDTLGVWTTRTDSTNSIESKSGFSQIN